MRKFLLLLILSVSGFTASAADRLMHCPIVNMSRSESNISYLSSCALEESPAGDDCAIQLKEYLTKFYGILLAANRAGQYAFEKYSYIMLNCGIDKVARGKATELMLDILPRDSEDRRIYLERERIDGSFNFRNIIQFFGTVFLVGDFIENHYAESEMGAIMANAQMMKEIIPLSKDLAEKAVARIRVDGLFPPIGGVQ